MIDNLQNDMDQIIYSGVSIVPPGADSYLKSGYKPLKAGRGLSDGTLLSYTSHSKSTCFYPLRLKIQRLHVCTLAVDSYPWSVSLSRLPSNRHHKFLHSCQRL